MVTFSSLVQALFIQGGKAAICNPWSPVQFHESLHSHKMNHFAEALFDLTADSYKYLERFLITMPKGASNDQMKSTHILIS